MTSPPTPWLSVDRRQLRAAAVVLVALAVLGVVLGVVWSVWSPQRPVGFVLAPHAIQPDETEAFAAADGRFAVLTALAGIAAAVVVWFVRSIRGPLAVVALGGGGLIGAWFTSLVGNALGGGSSTGPTQTLIAHLPLQLHMVGLVVIEAALAVLVYGLCVAFAAEDDLGRGDGPRPALPVFGEPPPAGSVGVGGDAQYGWGHGDGPSAVQQPGLAP